MSAGDGVDEERRRRLIKLASAAAFLAIAGVAVAIAIAGTQSDGGDTDLEGVGAITGQLRGIPQRGLVLGDPSAKVTLVEYGDLQCPACKVYAEEIVPEVIEAKVRGGEAKVEFRNFTIIGEESVPAGAAAVAAGEQGRGWEFVELFYRNQGFEGSGYVTDDFLTAVAEGAGVPDIARWNRERRDERVLAEVEWTTAEAQRLGLGGTPSFAVEGPRTEGLEPIDAESAEDLEAAIDRAG
ncbi:MAG TPA: thioredoxin domain-containing protein [Solirubrobacterales bacterium]|nr:thioredoxin domain-containing protein [Solirubrobacterales bacterium]